MFVVGDGSDARCAASADLVLQARAVERFFEVVVAFANGEGVVDDLQCSTDRYRRERPEVAGVGIPGQITGENNSRIFFTVRYLDVWIRRIVL